MAKDNVRPEEQENNQGCAMQTLALSIPYENSMEDYAFWRTLLSHIDGLYVKEVDSIIGTRFAQVFCDAGKWKIAEGLYVHVMEAWKRFIGEEHPNTLWAISSLVS
jgi:hypothetical protein